MRLKLIKIVVILLLAGSSDGRPQQLEVPTNLQPKIENTENTEGWRPLQTETKISQESIPVGKDLPQIVEGNSRYTEEGREKSYDRNNSFYEDRILVFGYRKSNDRSHGRLDLNSKIAKRSDPLDGTRHRRKDEVEIRSRNSDGVKISSRHMIDGNKVKSIDSKNNNIGNRTTDNSSQGSDPLISTRKKISSSYRGQVKSNPLLNSNLSNAKSLRPSESRVLKNDSQTRMNHFAKVRPSILHSQQISDDYKDNHVNGEKVVNFVRISSGHSSLKNSTNKQSQSQKIENKFDRKNHEAGNEKYDKSSLKNSSRYKTNSSQGVSDLKLKNWPNENLQNIEDLFNYEKYTSFDNTDEHSGVQEITDHPVSPGNLINSHEGSGTSDKKTGSKPSVLILNHLSPGVTVVNDPESQSNLEQSTEEEVHWEEIYPMISSSDASLVTDTNEDGFNPIPEVSQPNRPINPDHDLIQDTNHHAYGDGSSSGINPPSQIAQNYNDESVQDEAYHQNQYGNNFDVTRPTSETNVPSYGLNSDKQAYFNPTSIVSQNTVVHIINAGKKRPNVTVTKIKLTPHRNDSSLKKEDLTIDGKNSSAAIPNVHIMFTDEKDEGEGKEPTYGSGNQETPGVTYDDNVDCPTIKINSYTRINNTVQGKEGCTDLNIIISSHVLNTNVFEPASTSAVNHGSENDPESQRYPATPGGGYGTNFPTENGQNTGGLISGDFQDYPVSQGENIQGVKQDGQFSQQSPGTSTFEVFQQTEINVGLQNDVPGSGDALDPSVSNDPQNPENALSDISGSPEAVEANVPLSPGSVVEGDPSSPGALPESGILSDPVAPGELADDPGSGGVIGNPAAGGGLPSFPPLDEIQGPLADEGPAEVAADAPISSGSGGSSGFPSLSNPLSGISNPLSGISNPLSGISNPLSGVSNPLSGISNPLSGNGGNPLSQLGGSGSQGSILDDEDDDDLLDLVPFSIIESVTSVLPYFTLLNPLNFGFLSLAISPIAVAVASIFGVVAAFVPFALRGAFNFGRAADRVTIRLRPNLEEAVKRSIHQYENWNEWKSKRKKGKR